jgi:hypothetical protein
MLLFLGLLLGTPSFAQDPPPSYTDRNSVQAARHLEAWASRQPEKLSETERGEWVRARFAWIALLRLEGKVPEALAAFEGCGTYCAKHGPSEEWKALKAWGCGKKKNAKPCK